MPRYTAVLDACVLVPVSLAGTLLRIAEKGLYRPLWSGRILAEARQAIGEIHPGADTAKRFADMQEAFGDALVTGWEGLQAGIFRPDDDDRHVVAAGVQGRSRRGLWGEVTVHSAESAVADEVVDEGARPVPQPGEPVP